MAFAVITALALLLMPVAPVAPEAAAGEPRPTRFRLHDALMHFQTSLEGVMVEPRDG